MFETHIYEKLSLYFDLENGQFRKRKGKLKGLERFKTTNVINYSG